MLLALEQATATSPIRPRTVQQASGCARLTIHAIMPALYTHPTCPILDKPTLIAYAQPALTAVSGIPYLLLPTGLGSLQEASRSASCRVSSRSAERRCGSTSTGSSAGA